MSSFKIAILSIFAVSIVVGIALFALSKSSSSELSANLVVWGTISSEAFDTAYRNSSLAENKQVNISYVQKDTSTFDADFVESLAESRGPDIIILREDFIYKHRNKLFTIPFESYTERRFKDEFIEAGEVFLSPNGIIAVPFILDPLVMYWNRDMFSNSLVSKPPIYWDEYNALVEKFTKKDNNASILQSTIALGEWRNITNAKEILSMLLIQAGTPIIAREKGVVTTVLNEQFNYAIAPSTSATNFYTQFSNPTSPVYTWNRSLPSSFNMFLSGNLAMYIGFASEIFSIQQKNSNLNFDVTYVPQIRNTPKKNVFGHMHVLSIVKQSQQIAGAFLAINGMTEPKALRALEQVTNLPPVRRDLLGDKPSDAFRIVFYNSALISDSWLDPNSIQSTVVFRDMIESITSGRSRTSEALNRAGQELNQLLQ